MTAPAQQQEWTIHCRCNDKLVSVEPEMVDGAYAVHLTISNGKATGPGYSITHRASGYALWHVREFDAAVRVAHWLDENLKLPETEDGARLWKQNLNPNERMQIADALTSIAPREWWVG